MINNLVKALRSLTEGAIMIALAQVLGYLKFYEMPNGGAVTLSMIPIVFYAVRWGLARGLLAAFTFGLMQLLLDGAYAYTWQSMILDYALAFSMLGVAGAFKNAKLGVFYGTVVGGALQLVMTILSGVFVWAEYMPEEFFGMPVTNPWVYSTIYNSIYIGANIVIALAVFASIYKPMNRYIRGEDLE